MLITEMLRRAAQLKGRETAVRSDNCQLTWNDVVERAGRLAGGLNALGLNRGDRVAVLSHNNIAFYDAYVALPWAGCIMTCLNTRWSMAELVDAINDSGARALLVDDHFEIIANDLTVQCRSLDYIIAAQNRTATICWETLATQSEPISCCTENMHDLAYIFYTGGTTGRAKGVMISHLNFCAAAVARLHTGDFSEESIIAISVPMFHVGGAAFMGASLAAAGQIRLLPSFEPRSTMAAVQEVKATHVGWVPTMLSAILNHPEVGSFDLSSLRRITYGAAPMAPNLLAQAANRLPHIGFVQFYGMTESTATGTWLSATDHRSSDETRTESIGRAWPGLELKIINPDGSPVPQGEIGEICLRGPTIMSGYWRQPEKTSEVLKEGWLHTGDVGRLTDGGYVFLVDRLKDMIITGGENVYSTEVENVLLSYPGIRECAVIGLPNAHWGELVCAVLYVDPDVQLDTSALEAHCRRLIAGFKLPRRIIQHSGPLPKSAIGKILKRDLRKIYTE